MYVPTHPKTQKACVYCETRVTVKCEVCLCRGRGDRVRPASGSAVNETARAGYPVTARVTNLLDAPRCPHHGQCRVACAEADASDRFSNLLSENRCGLLRVGNCVKREN